MILQTVCLGEVLELLGREKVGDRELPIMSITMRDGLIDQAQRFKKRIASKEISGYKVVRLNELVVGFPIDEGVLGFQRKYQAAAVSPAYDVWRVRNASQVDHDYLERYLRSPQAINTYRARMRGAVSRRRVLTKDDFREIEVPFPPIDEQRRIAAILHKANTLRAKRREAIVKLDQLLQSVFLDMFGDPATNPKGWPLKSLEELCDPEDRINYGVVQPGSEFPDGVPVVRVGDMEGGRLDLTSVKRIDPTIEASYSRSRLKGNELLLSCVGSIGTVAVVPQSAIGFNIARAVTRVPLIDSEKRLFIQQCLRTPALQRYFVEKTRTVSQATLNVEFVKSAMVFDPPASMIHWYCDLVERVNKARDRQVVSEAHIERCFASVQQRAFQGAV